MKKIINTLAVLLLIATATTQSSAQSTESSNRSLIGLDIQVYPTGIIPGVRYEAPLSPKSSLHLRAGYQIIDHRDLGVQDDETGSGYGFSVGYKRYLKSDLTGWAFMLKNDVWFNKIDWVNNEVAPNENPSGTSNITVIQPTVQAEYGFMLGENAILSPSAAFGLEWNVATDGEPTGEGPILLLGVSLGFFL